jgi:rhamnopyranosyl-N-acetylglucosaminyl-diphospho-decaprenol beta-1,3/1,4-galactofuranosyltransferase
VAEHEVVHRVKVDAHERVLGPPQLQTPSPDHRERARELRPAALASQGPAQDQQQQLLEPATHGVMVSAQRDRDGGVCAVVVTRNRRELLRRCLSALQAQRRAPDGVLVVDNASSDGTAEMVASEFPAAELLRLDANLGGAGGFHRGMARAHAQGYEWLWLLDDDTLATEGALAALLDGARRAPGQVPLVVTSQVRWKDERLHPMNAPVPRARWRAELAQGIACRLLLVRYATFVSTLVHRQAIDRFGLPLEHFFIWSDDVEFTARVLRHAPGYLVPDSVVYHWTETAHPAADPHSDRFYYHARNALLILRGSSLSPLERIDFARYVARSIAAYVRVNRRDRRRLMLLARALRDGLSEATR